ncbi:MgtC family protein [Erwiniaceae bacterium BAC15a-03b]|uniref:Protein MgtC n=1 Tax=Winslowiella arboricola TaxID=2978220 RepID=A0A9J6PY39_9GAMM|nr:MgtC family protein [Winslowiella arboricola]MCU5772903.1 MgtC family protein [Winslowiella arboricola]MCU5780669.1 MgtC family protein [Winslowiella arboricola]
MAWSPFIVHLALAVLLGAVIGAERQWRQRMAGLRTNALVATGAAIFILSSASTSPESPGRIAAQVVSGIGFLGAGVIMRQGMSISGLNTAATLWCSAAVGVLCGLGQFANASAATLVLLCANILLREAAQRINLQPKTPELDIEQCYCIQITCGAEDEILVRTLILQAINGMALRLQSLCSADIARPGQLEVSARILAFPHAQRELENIVCRISLEKSVSAVHWRVAESSV